MTAVEPECRAVIGGERIQLREVRPSDVTDRYIRWMNDPEVGRYLETRFVSHRREQIETYVKQMAEDPDTAFLAIIVRNPNTHIGNIKIGPINRFHLFADVSLIIGERQYWGKGYGTEAIERVVAYGFNTLGLHKLTAGIYAGNIGSIRAFTKAGFAREGVRRKHRFFEGAYVDEVIMGILRPE